MSDRARDDIQEAGETEQSLVVIHPTVAPTIAGPRLGLPTLQELETLKAYGQLVVDSGMAPSHVKTWEAAVVIMRYGHQLGVDEFTALQNMYVIAGKPAMQASLMHSMILRAHGPNAIHILKFDSTASVLECRPRGARKPTVVSYPADLLFARAVSRAGRLVFRDVTMGMYVPEELDGNVIEVDGEVIDLDQQQRHVHVRELRQEHEAEQTQAVIHDGGKATKAQLQKILELGQTLGMTEAQVAQHVGKPGKDLTALEAETIRKGLAEQIEARIQLDSQTVAEAAQPVGAGGGR